MPNGGSDCCGTCCFNSEVAAGKDLHAQHDPQTCVRCLIRDVEIEVPFWTYCANHPYHNPERLETPLGPIYIDAGEGFPYRRKVLWESPDSQEVRFQLLSLLVDIEETPRNEYPTWTQLDETVIRQLGEFRERRAVGEFRRILAFDPYASPQEGASVRNRVPTIACALQALAKTLGDEALPEVRRCLTLGLSAAQGLSAYDPDEDELAMIRAAAVEALQYVSAPAAAELAFQALQDVHSHVVESARGILAQGQR